MGISQGGERYGGNGGVFSLTHLEVLGDFTDEPLEGELPDEELSGFLVPPDFTEGDGSGTESMGLLHTTSGSLHGPVVSEEKRGVERVVLLLSSLRPWLRVACAGLCLGKGGRWSESDERRRR